MDCPHLFALYMEIIMREIHNMDALRIGGTVINNLRYAVIRTYYQSLINESNPNT